MDKGSHNTLELLAQYDDNTSLRDKAIEHIERRVVSEDTRPSYDDLFKENVRLKLQLKEQETEIEGLKKLIEGIKSVKANNTVTIVDQTEKQALDEAYKREFVLPPRSADRQKNAKNLFLSLPGISSDVKNVSERSYSDVIDDTGSKLSPHENMVKSESIEDIKSPIKTKVNLNASEDDESPAASVTYKTSRITIASPHSPSRSVASNRAKSPQSANRIAAVINNQVHSPLRGDFDNRTEVLPINLFGSSTVGGDVNLKSPISQIQSLKAEEKSREFSPSSKQNLNKFADFLEDSFGQNQPDISVAQNKGHGAPHLSPPSPPPPPSFPSASQENDVPPSLKLGSPVILNRKEPATKESVATKSPLHSSINRLQASAGVISSVKQRSPPDSLHNRPFDTGDSFVGSTTTTDSESVKPNAVSFNNAELPREINRRSSIPLFVQPEDFRSVRITVLSTLYHEAESQFDEPQVLFSVIDRNSEKEMFKFSKTITKVNELDAYLKPRIPSVSLPLLPDRQLLDSLTPSRVDSRREALNQYFKTLFLIAEFPQTAALKVAQFMSTDTVMNPALLGDTVKEGTLLMRKPKTLGNTSNWRARYGVLGGEFLTLFDRGQPTEKIRLKQSSIELLPNLPEDRHGTKNGFVINEHKKSGLSSTTKYFLCAETSKEREIWVSAISEFITGTLIPPSSSTGSLSTNGESNASFAKFDNGSSVDQIYVTDLTLDSGNQSSGDPSSSWAPRETESNATYEETKESKRLKMRSFFPFKKITSNALNMMYDDTETIASQESEPKFSDNSIARSLESMNLTSDRQQNKVFGSSLENCLRLSSHKYVGRYEIPSVVYRCLEFLYKNHGIQEEGLFRLSGSSALIKSLQEQFDSEYDVDLFNYNRSIPDSIKATSGVYIDVNTVSGLLKLYLRKLPHLLFGEEGYASFKYIADEHHDDPSQIAYKFRDLIRSGSIPEPNLSLMYCLFELLLRIQENQRYNKMNARNLCIVFSPTLNVPVTILQPLIIDFVCIFQGGEPVEQDRRQDLDAHIPQV